MKKSAIKLLSLFFVLAFVVACNNTPNTATEGSEDSTTMESMDKSGDTVSIEADTMNVEVDTLNVEVPVE